jgi:enoyl-CoA hydratase
MSQAVIYERRDAVAVMTINRPERRNAIDGPTADGLEAGYRSFVGDDAARVLVITGAGDQAFSAGADLKAIESLMPRTETGSGVFGVTRLQSPKPTIAAISGWCVGGGLILALWCDLRVAAESAHFGIPERKWGLPFLDGGALRLATVVGVGRALDLVLTGRDMTAEEARDMGLVTEVVAAGQHLNRALELAETIASFPQEALLADRRLLIGDVNRWVASSLEEDGRIRQELTDTGAYERGVGEFAERAR